MFKQSIKNFSKKVCKSEKGQGAVEYILLLVAVVGVVLVFKDSILEQVDGLLQQLSTNISQIGNG